MNAFFKKLQLDWLSSANLKWIWVSVAVLSGGLALAWDHDSSPQPSVHRDSTPMALDTYIPAGYVLVPIQVSNYESLDSILGQYGTVDLFLPSAHQGQKALKVASRIKILRAPQNPSQFAVLARTEDSEKLLTQGANFFVVIQNTKEPGAGFVMHESKPEPKHGASSRLVVETSDD